MKIAMRPIPRLIESFSPEASNWIIELGFNETWTLELLPLPDAGGIDIEGVLEPEAPDGKTIGELEGPGCIVTSAVGKLAEMNSSIGDGVPLATCSPSKAIAKEVKPLMPTTGVARTARDV